MNDETNIHSVGIQINFPTWEKFNLDSLTNDGVVFFQYLILRCQHSPEWTHSDNDMRQELGLKQTRLSSLTKKFVDYKILDTRIVRNKYDNKITSYRINFLKLSEIGTLKLIYREKTPSGQLVNLAEYSKVYKAMHAAQPKKDAKLTTKDKNQAGDYTSKAKVLADTLKSTFDSRRKVFNDRRTGNNKKAAGTVHFSPSHIRRLTKVLRHFGGDSRFITDAFIAFGDALNLDAVGMYKGEMLPTETLRDPLNYFLSYSNKLGSSGEEYDPDSDNKSFAVIYTFGNNYGGSYYEKNP